jgi:ABC-type branched-subunit amino acid transport system substrate-binding protein
MDEGLTSLGRLGQLPEARRRPRNTRPKPPRVGISGVFLRHQSKDGGPAVELSGGKVRQSGGVDVNPRWSRPLAGGLVVLALAACGTTVPVASTGSAAGQDGLGTAGTAVGGGTTDGTQTPLGEGATSTSAAGSADAVPTGPQGGTGTGAVSSPAGGDGAASGGAAVSAARGTTKPLTIGVITSGNAGAFASSVGVGGNFGDQRKQAEALASYLNARGGIAGRKISLVYYDYDAGLSADANAQAACVTFTEDRDVFAAIGIAGMTDAYHECAKKHGLVVLSDGDIKAGSFFRRYPTTIVISDLDITRKYAAMVNALHEQKFFSPGAKIGLLYMDERNDLEGIRDGMKPALARLGLKVDAESQIAGNASPSDYAAALSSSVLNFRSKGITHVLFGAASAAFWAQSAASQEYYPYLGIESRQSPGLLMQSFNSPRSLEKAYGIGYQPVQDVDASRDPGFLNPNHKLCKKVLDDAGQGWGANRLGSGTAMYLCDQLFFLSAVLRGQGEATPSALLDGVAALGRTYQSPLTFSTAFSAARHDGADAYRLLRYRADCRCFSYVSPSRPFRP